jgi:hypothetical protein
MGKELLSKKRRKMLGDHESRKMLYLDTAAKLGPRTSAEMGKRVLLQ